MNDMYKNWRINVYHVYGDRSNKDWSYQELKEYFEIDGSDVAVCIKRFEGQFFTFNVGSFARINVTEDGFFRIKM